MDVIVSHTKVVQLSELINASVQGSSNSSFPVYHERKMKATIIGLIGAIYHWINPMNITEI